MRTMIRSALVAAAVALGAALLGGCSGAGTPAANVEDANLRSIVTDNLSAIVLITSWSQMLYKKASGTPSPQTRTELPDGSLRCSWRNSDDSEGEWIFLVPFEVGAVRGTITWPDLSYIRRETAGPVWSENPRRSASHWIEEFSNGSSIDYTNNVEFRTHLREALIGTAQTEQATMHFRIDRVQEEQDRLTFDLPDGSHLTLTIPTILGTAVYSRPRFRLPATGQFTGSDGNVLNMTFKGTTADAWDSLEIAAADGTTGMFTLTNDVAGSGQLRQGGEAVGALTWDADGAGILDLIGVGHQSVNPSAAARDFQITNWINHVALLGPAPRY